MIRIFGTMTDPSDSPVPGAIIELRAISSTNEVLLGSTVNHKCDQQGAYSFQLAAGMYDAYAQNDRCGDMDYLGTAKVSANSVDGDLYSILVDGGINITPPMLDSALAAAQRAESAAALTAADRVSTGQNAESAKADSAAAKAARDEAVSASGTAVSAKESIVSDARDVRGLAVQVASQATDVSAKHSDVVAKAAQVSAQADVVSTKHGEVVAKAAQVSDDASSTQSAKNISVAAADTATQKAASAATHDASAQDAATRAENAASAVVGAVLDGGECDLSTGVYPLPITVAGKKYSTIWYVAVAGSVSGVAFDVGDLLRYTTAKTGYYFKVDAKDDVYSVNNEKGAVVITPEKIGAEKTGIAQQLVDQHASKNGAHSIAGVQGLTEALADKYSSNNKPSAETIGAEPAGAVASAVTSHEAKVNAHPISGVSGLQAALDAKPSRNILINGEVTRINQRGFDGNWANLAVGAYGYDRWKKADATSMSQVVEAGNFITGAKYRLSGAGVTAATLTAPASGNWTVTVPQSARNVQLELGETSTQFEVRNIQQELAMCQRYFENGNYVGSAYYDTAGNQLPRIAFKVTKRAAPIMTAFSPSGTNFPGPSFYSVTVDGAGVATSAGNIPAKTILGVFAWDANAEL
ncbi:prophage tail fiber N-terminal domain-containing protein [Aeromonas sp. SG16]|uniref:prophage tail fiber N-terminal domain-containing protein n=1 Tax=Aeromonas sp. SG16 TaxID=2950548 RepID=UPI00210BF4EE|nr:prophage tail fiber N-terminal domain-containing protein [Aeromonas sp. SG16]MCQ4052361.1 prophage tail fiber N-terminal domain-containing protein [Aeromonas sp. SG16]